jgi:hypothetical protein
MKRKQNEKEAKTSVIFALKQNEAKWKQKKCFFCFLAGSEMKIK